MATGKKKRRGNNAAQKAIKHSWSLKQRLLCVLGVTVFLFLLLLGRLFYVQVSETNAILAI